MQLPSPSALWGDKEQIQCLFSMTASHSIIHSLIQQTFIELQPYAGTEKAKVKNTKPCFQECPSLWSVTAFWSFYSIGYHLLFLWSSLMCLHARLPCYSSLLNELEFIKVLQRAGPSAANNSIGFAWPEQRTQTLTSLPLGVLMRWCNQRHLSITSHVTTMIFLFDLLN